MERKEKPVTDFSNTKTEYTIPASGCGFVKASLVATGMLVIAYKQIELLHLLVIYLEYGIDEEKTVQIYKMSRVSA